MRLKFPASFSRARAWLASPPACAAPAPGRRTPLPAGPQRVRFETTLGAFTVEVDPARAPLTAAEFPAVRPRPALRRHDLPPGDRQLRRSRAVGYLPDGTEKPVRAGVPNESGNGLSNRRGTVAMARTGDPHSGTSQFYVNVADNIALDPSPSRWGYAVFGRVVEGMDVVDRIASVATGVARPVRRRHARCEPVVIATRPRRRRGSHGPSERRPPQDAAGLGPAPRSVGTRRSRGSSSSSCAARRAQPARSTSSATCSRPGSATTIPIRPCARSCGAARTARCGRAHVFHARQPRFPARPALRRGNGLHAARRTARSSTCMASACC